MGNRRSPHAVSTNFSGLLEDLKTHEQHNGKAMLGCMGNEGPTQTADLKADNAGHC